MNEDLFPIEGAKFERPKTRVLGKVAEKGEILQISGKSRLVNYHNRVRYHHVMLVFRGWYPIFMSTLLEDSISCLDVHGTS